MPRFCDVKPDASQRAVKHWLVGRSLDCTSERQHGQVQVPGLRVREANGDASLETTIQGRQNVQLLDFLRMPVQRTKQVRQFFAGWDRTRRELNSLLQLS